MDSPDLFDFQPERKITNFTIGMRFYVVLPDGKHGLVFLNKRYDMVVRVDKKSGEVEGLFSSAHFSICELVREQPEQLKKK